MSYVNEVKKLIECKLFDMLSVLLESDEVKVTGTLNEFGNKQYIEMTITSIKSNDYKSNCMNKPE